MSNIFCFGLGFTALRLAKKLRAEGWSVSGTCRTAEKCRELKRQNINAYIFDDIPGEDLNKATHILHSIPPDENGDPVFNRYIEKIKENENLKWFGYLSTTGVYGDHKGGWVSEESDLLAGNERSLNRIEAEKKWLFSNLPIHIFRLAGIYGPGRSAIDQVRSGKAKRINKEGQVFSRIHVDDIVQILTTSIAKPNPESIYNCADDEPAPQHEVIAYACELLKQPLPPMQDFETAELSEMAKSFYQSNRRVNNKKIKQELGVRLLFPNYKIGLNSIN